MTVAPAVGPPPPLSADARLASQPTAAQMSPHVVSFVFTVYLASD